MPHCPNCQLPLRHLGQLSGHRRRHYYRGVHSSCRLRLLAVDLGSRNGDLQVYQMFSHHCPLLTVLDREFECPALGYDLDRCLGHGGHAP